MPVIQPIPYEGQNVTTSPQPIMQIKELEPDKTRYPEWIALKESCARQKRRKKKS
jgi:hypothetical protein